MNRLQLEDAVFDKTGYDMDIIEGFTDSQLRDILRNNEPVKPEAQTKPTRETVQPLKRVAVEYVEHEGKLHRLERFANGDSVRVLCGERVRFDGRIVCASIVLHWLRTGEMVRRVPRAKKIKAAIRHNGRVIHLGRFDTREAVEAAKTAAKFRISMGLEPIG